jgi:hypothetical protein
MRIISSVTLAAVLAVPFMLGTTPPAVAGPVCNELDLNSPCVRSSDLRANIMLGGSGDEGRLRLRNGDGDTAVQLRATNGNVTNLFSNDENESNGLVKAWARINSDGTILGCWRCNKDPDETRRIDTGNYEVDFTPLSTDIRGRPRAVTLDGAGQQSVAVLQSYDRVGDASSVQVLVILATAGGPTNTQFALLIY